MKLIRSALLAFLSIALIISCKKEKSLESGYTGNLNAEWEFKVGKQYKGHVDTAYIQDFGVGIQALFLEGTSDDGKEILSIQVINIDLTKPATYKTPGVLFTYLKNSDLLYANDVLAAGEFELVITRIDSVSVSGTFNGRVKDSAGALKTVTDGKFSAKLKKAVAPPPVTTCKLSTIGYYFMPGATLDGAVNTFFTGPQITSIQVYDSASSTLFNDFPVTYIPGKIMFGTDQIFTLNPDGTGMEQGTVSQYEGFLVPFDNSTDSVIVKYEYDANKFMTRRTLFIPAAPTIPILETVYAWTGGNMTRIVNTLAITNERWETEIQYDNTKTAKNFINLQFLAYELLQFQTAINTGKRPVNIPITGTTKYFENNVLKSTDVSNFINYVIDANNYVRSFEITGADYDSYLYWGGEKYVLGYKCF